MILIISNKNDLTVDYFLNELPTSQHDTFRLNTEDFLDKYEFGFNFDKKFKSWYIKNNENGKDISHEKIKGIWYRRPELPSVKTIIDVSLRNALMLESKYLYEYLIGSIKCNWMSVPENIRRAENKLLQIQKAKELGFNVPKMIVTNSPTEAKKFLTQNKKVCIKAIRNGIYSTASQKYIIYNKILNSDDEKGLDSIKNYPVYLQEYIEKRFELRVIVVKNTVYSVLIDSQMNEETREDWRVNNCKSVIYKNYSLPTSIKNKCLKIVKYFGLNFSSMDLAVTEKGKYYFFDLNPNGQWGWLDSKLNLNISSAIKEFLENGK